TGSHTVGNVVGLSDRVTLEAVGWSSAPPVLHGHPEIRQTQGWCEAEGEIRRYAPRGQHLPKGPAAYLGSHAPHLNNREAVAPTMGGEFRRLDEVRQHVHAGWRVANEPFQALDYDEPGGEVPIERVEEE